MKKKLALLMAAIMTVAMVPMTAFASTSLNVGWNVNVGVGDDNMFNNVIEITNDNEYVGDATSFEIVVTLTNGKFAKEDFTASDGTEYENKYMMEESVFLTDSTLNQYSTTAFSGIEKIEIFNSTTAYITVSKKSFNVNGGVLIPIRAYAVDAGDVIANVWSNQVITFDMDGVIATAYDGDISIESEGVVTFVEDADDAKNIEAITIDGLVNGAITDGTITLKLKGNYKFNYDQYGYLLDEDGQIVYLADSIKFLNNSGINVKTDGVYKVSDNELIYNISGIDTTQVAKITISGISIIPKSSCDAGDVATITVGGTALGTSEKLEVAKMVEEAVTYSVEDDDLPEIWAGKNYDLESDSNNTLKIYVEENTGDILNTSRKATFTFPDGIEVVDIDVNTKKELKDSNFTYTIDENVVTIKYYGESDESDAADFGIAFLINAAPTYEGDVTVVLGGEFDDVEFTVATVKAPYTIEAKTSEVLIDYRYVPVNEIVITEAEEGILAEDTVIVLSVEKMDFEDAGTYEVTEGDIEVDVEIETDDEAQLMITIEDESTEASTIVISGLELYLDRTLPVGGYALIESKETTGNHTILWENSTDEDDEDFASYNYSPAAKAQSNGLFKLSDLTVNDSYVEVVTAARDQDDSTTSRKIIITIGATTMSVGTETVTLDAPAYINSEDYTMLPVRAISEAFGATVTWDDASKTVTVLSGQRIISMTIGSKTMYINGTPVAMN
ncbi:MAG: copper amine oxidase N-terminal domain-containing protein, partial [Clostridiales bacterium]|nr:copper amine oxidase N-terminal domain-containing protein [Clostridiales bacterium]